MPETGKRRTDGAAADRRFEREELGELLRLFSALGITLAACIAGCFLAGLKLDAWLAEAGWNTRGLGKVGGLVIGLAAGVSWAYLRIARHLKKFAPDAGSAENGGGENR